MARSIACQHLPRCWPRALPPTALLRLITTSKIVGLDPIHSAPRSGKSAAAYEFLKDVKLPRPILILLVVLVVIVGALFVLASLDRAVPVEHIETPVAANAATH